MGCSSIGRVLSWIVVQLVEFFTVNKEVVRSIRTYPA